MKHLFAAAFALIGLVVTTGAFAEREQGPSNGPRDTDLTELVCKPVLKICPEGCYNKCTFYADCSGECHCECPE